MVSVTKLNTFRWCKRQYQLKYIDHLPTLPTPLMDRGIYVHSLLSAYILGKDMPPEPSDSWVADTGKKIYQQAIKIFKPAKNSLSEIRIEREYKGLVILGIIDYMDNDSLIDFKALDKMKDYRSPLQLAVYRYLIGKRKYYRYLHATTTDAKFIDVDDKILDFYDIEWKRTIDEITDYTMEYELSGNPLPDRKTKYCKKYCSFYPICFGKMTAKEYIKKIKEAI